MAKDSSNPQVSFDGGKTVYEIDTKNQTATPVNATSEAGKALEAAGTILTAPADVVGEVIKGFFR